MGWGQGTGCLFSHYPGPLAKGCWGRQDAGPAGSWLEHRGRCWQLAGCGGYGWALTASAALTEPGPRSPVCPLENVSCQALFPQLPSLGAHEAAPSSCPGQTLPLEPVTSTSFIVFNRYLRSSYCVPRAMDKKRKLLGSLQVLTAEERDPAHMGSFLSVRRWQPFPGPLGGKWTSLGAGPRCQVANSPEPPSVPSQPQHPEL